MAKELASFKLFDVLRMAGTPSTRQETAMTRDELQELLDEYLPATAEPTAYLATCDAAGPHVRPATLVRDGVHFCFATSRRSEKDHSLRSEPGCGVRLPAGARWEARVPTCSRTSLGSQWVVPSKDLGKSSRIRRQPAFPGRTRGPGLDRVPHPSDTSTLASTW